MGSDLEIYNWLWGCGWCGEGGQGDPYPEASATSAHHPALWDHWNTSAIAPWMMYYIFLQVFTCCHLMSSTMYTNQERFLKCFFGSHGVMSLVVVPVAGFGWLKQDLWSARLLILPGISSWSSAPVASCLTTSWNRAGWRRRRCQSSKPSSYHDNDRRSWDVLICLEEAMVWDRMLPASLALYQISTIVNYEPQAEKMQLRESRFL